MVEAEGILLRGDLSAFAFLEVLQLVGTGTEAVSVVLSDGPRPFGRVLMVRGRVLDAQAESLQGVDAFASLLRVCEGDFVVRRARPPIGPAPLDVPLDQLLVSCAQREDASERRGREGCTTMAIAVPPDETL